MEYIKKWRQRVQINQLNNNKKLFESKYKLEKVIGKGGFGVVFSGKRLKDNLPVTIKEVYSYECEIDKDPIEIILLQQVQDVPGVIKMLEYYKTKHSYYIVMEYFKGQELWQYIHQHKPLQENVIKHIFQQLVNIIIQCHNKGVFHRDIKDENILINNKLELKLIDFGCGTWLEKRVYKQINGTYIYHPPEWFWRRQYHPDSLTVWTLGIVLYALFYDQLPFQNQAEICNGKLKFNSEISSVAKDLVTLCLEYEPENRIPLLSILNHAWFNPVVEILE